MTVTFATSDKIETLNNRFISIAAKPRWLDDSAVKI